MYTLLNTAGSLIRTEELVKLSKRVFFFPAEVIRRCWALPCSICQTRPLIFLLSLYFLSFSSQDIVHENLKMGSDGESDQASGTSSDEVQSPTGVCLRNRGNRRISAEVGFVSLSFQTFYCPCFTFLFLNWGYVKGYESLAALKKLWRVNMLPLWIMANLFLPGFSGSASTLFLKVCFD